MFILNPGTKPIKNGFTENAIEIAKEIINDLKKDFPNLITKRNLKRDSNGYIYFKLQNGNNIVELDLPTQEKEIFFKSKPWVSSRCYVDGSSWLYCFAYDIIKDKLRL